MKIPTVTHNEIIELRSNLLEVLIKYGQTVPLKERILSISDMALMTGKTKIFVKSSLESLQQNGSITVERNRIIINKMVLK